MGQDAFGPSKACVAAHANVGRYLLFCTPRIVKRCVSAYTKMGIIYVYNEEMKMKTKKNTTGKAASASTTIICYTGKGAKKSGIHSDEEFLMVC